MTGVVALVAMYEVLSAVAVPDIASATGLSPRTSNSVTVTPRGGSGSYTHSWAYTSGDTFGVGSPTSATTTFSKGGAPGSYAGTYTDTVTDAAGFTFPVPVSVEIELL